MTGSSPDNSGVLVPGGGCFWCLDAAYQLLTGVFKVTCGYAGGHVDNPSYDQVYAATTGHVEVVKIDYDPSQISLGCLLEFFRPVHDSTRTDGPGAEDLGTRYRSVIYYANETQKSAAENSRAVEQATLRTPIATEISPLKKFWPAEEYHQDYFAQHPKRAYCAAVIKPQNKTLPAALAGNRE